MNEFSKEPGIDVVKNPYRVEKSHGILVSRTKSEMGKTGRKIQDIWSSFVDFGIERIFLEAQRTRGIVEFEASGADGVAWYETTFRYSGIDVYAQPIDVFHMIKLNPDNNEPPLKMAVATYNGQRSKFTRLVALESEEEGEKAQRHLFHFDRDELSHLEQSTPPQVLFPSESGSNQFFRITRTDGFGGEIELQVGGVEDDEQNIHLYKHIGRGLVATNRLRVADPIAGRVELVIVSSQGIVEEPAAFTIPEAITHIGNFEPAIAA